MPRFTVLLPVHRPPALLPFAIDSVLAQEHTDFELFIVCDGAPAETIACAEAYAARDGRVRTFPFAKGERHGEAHRHAVLALATGELVAQIADDDLWLPNHLGELSALLADADFGHTLHTSATPDGAVLITAGNLASPLVRDMMLRQLHNTFGPTSAGYRLAAYRRLPDGWSPAPPEVWTDLHMWRKFLRCDGLLFATRYAVTGLHFAAAARPGMILDERVAENRLWQARLADAAGCQALVRAAWDSLVQHYHR